MVVAFGANVPAPLHVAVVAPLPNEPCKWTVGLLAQTTVWFPTTSIWTVGASSTLSSAGGAEVIAGLHAPLTMT
jgi:hypothetical protein